MVQASKANARRRFGKTMIVMATGGLLASCASLVGPRRIELSESRLQAGIARRFPLHNRLLDLFDVQINTPQLTILPDSDRVSLALAVSVAPPFIRESWDGTMALSGRLVLDANRSAVLLQDPHVDRFAVAGIDGSKSRDLGRAVDLFVNQLVRDTPVYTFRPEDLRYAGVQFVPTRLETAPRALVVTLEPVR